jgi:hypothetical protein
MARGRTQEDDGRSDIWKMLTRRKKRVGYYYYILARDRYQIEIKKLKNV